MKDLPPIPRVLTIAGSDSSGAAGVQADLKTFEGRGVYGMSVLTMLTAQNSSGIQAIHPLPPEFIAQQIDSVLSDVGADAIKTGLLLRADAIRLAAEKAARYKIKALIVDPVLIDGSGRRLIDAEAERAYRERLIPNALVVTPNLGEAKILSGRNIRNLLDMRAAAQAIAALGVLWVVVKGGHLGGKELIDLLYDAANKEFYEFHGPRLPASNPRGTGCTFASTIAAEVAKGRDVPAAVEVAQRYVFEALQAATNWKFGSGRGTLYHGYRLAERDRE